MPTSEFCTSLHEGKKKISKFTKTFIYWMYHSLPVHLHLPQKLAVVNQERKDVLHRHINEPAGTQLWQMSPTWDTLVVVNEAENPEPPLDYSLYVTHTGTHCHIDLFLPINQLRSRSFGVSAECRKSKLWSWWQDYPLTSAGNRRPAVNHWGQCPNVCEMLDEF